jgi:hypothetical protein
MKKPIIQLIFTDPILWRVAKDELPNQKTPYAGKYWVQVLAFDLDEFIDSGSCDPAHICYDFRKKQFITLAYGSKGTVWIPINVTHWLPLPPIPIMYDRTAKSKHGFRYFKGADNLAKKFAEIQIKKLS